MHNSKPDSPLVSCWNEAGSSQKVAAMNDAPACLKRAAECTRLAEATSDPEMKVYLLKLGLSWMQAATTARRDEQLLEEGHRRLKTLQDLVS